MATSPQLPRHFLILTNYASSSIAMLRHFHCTLHANILFVKLGCKGGSGAMEESGLMGGGQGDGAADSHPTSGTGN
jgi:hypothetical protein